MDNHTNIWKSVPVKAAKNFAYKQKNDIKFSVNLKIQYHFFENSKKV